VDVGYVAPFKTRELFCRCRACGLTSVFKVRAKDGLLEKVVDNIDLNTVKINVAMYFKVLGYVSTSDRSSIEPPTSLPPDVEAAFKEGARCLASQCPNAAAAMFRLALDLATFPRLPPPESAEPAARVRRDLGLRLQWLFTNAHLPAELRGLSDCVREDGNDGVHRGTISPEDAEDLQDFTYALLERLYSEPGRLQQAEQRRAARRAVPK
jgi:hypothetical protein